MMKQLLMLAALAATVSAHHEGTTDYKAIARVADPRGQEIQGNVTFTQYADGKVHIEGTILGLAHGKYGFHVHEKGDITGGCLSTGAHYNPHHKDHGSPADENRHVGDLGNIEFDENRIGRIDSFDSIITLIGPNNIIGRAIVLHEKADDLGRSNHPDSKKTGNAGGRVACGVIGILEPIDGWSNGAKTNAVTATVLIPFTSLIFIYH